MTSAVLIPNEFSRLKPADARHHDIQQDDGELIGLGALKRFLAGTRVHKVLTEFVEDGPQSQKIGRFIIHQENAGLRLGRILTRKA